ncbi:hypothetical protein ABE82_26415 (plasmid) [Paenibacillus peoriae]|uniref:hypothetical protein n=1 Tax=Paenibacillus peoriae TaxID=59893 RepID=UPI00071F2AD2|nr:hypothetical protein [Paenibacillus peoriae]ALS09951.1 hypothetical protein ABE82_26415 [Paenibacillus peoriae]
MSKAKIIPFLSKSPESKLTPDQRLKYHVLRELNAPGLILDGKVIDEMFTKLANAFDSYKKMNPNI